MNLLENRILEHSSSLIPPWRAFKRNADRVAATLSSEHSLKTGITSNGDLARTAVELG